MRIFSATSRKSMFWPQTSLNFSTAVRTSPLNDKFLCLLQRFGFVKSHLHAPLSCTNN
jgi:hypothetical protein